MTTVLTGSPTSITARPSATVTAPVDADAFSSAIIQSSEQTLLNYIQGLIADALLLSASNVQTAVNTAGLRVTGNGSGPGGVFVGGANANGLTATAGASGGNGAVLTGTVNGAGTLNLGHGSGAGSLDYGGATGPGTIGVGGATGGQAVGGVFQPNDTNAPVAANISLPQLAYDPSGSLTNGDLWVTAADVKVHHGGVTRRIARLDEAGSQALAMGIFTPAAGSYSYLYMFQAGVNQFIAPAAGKLSDLFAGLGSAGTGGTYTITVLKNGGSTGITCAVAANGVTVVSDTTHSATFLAGDVIQITYAATSVTGTPGNLCASVRITTD